MRIGGLAAGVFVVGLLTGMAGTAVAREEPSGFDCSAVMAAGMTGQDLSDIMSMMGGSMMGGSMMGGSMMGQGTGPGASMGPDMMGRGMGPDASGMPGALHQRHHPQGSPEASE
jgi:hypothetical protein